MDSKEIENIWKNIVSYHSKYLKEKGVKLPSLKDKNGYTKSALVLIRLAKNYPDTDIVSKQELTSFIKSFYPDISDVQQGRHLSMQSGWYILSGTRGDKNIPSGSYKLISLTEPYPPFAPARRCGYDGNFDEIKKKYNYRCACCGAEEGKEHYFRKGIIVKLQKGHMDPSLPLKSGNIIPQCQICNRPDRNRWIYDKTGRVIEIANTPDGFRVVKKFLKKADKKEQKELLAILTRLLKL